MSQRQIPWRRVITTDQAATLLGRSERRVRQLVASGHLSSYQPGRDLLLDRAEVEALRDQGPAKRGRPRQAS